MIPSLFCSSSESSAKETDKDINWFPLIAFIQSKGNMRREEILAAPLILINAINKEVSEIWRQEIVSRLNSSAAGMLGGSSPQSKIRADYDDFFADCRA